MSATKTARKPARKPAAKAKPKAKAPEPTRSEIISAAMLELSDERKAARAKRDGVPAKHLVYNEFFKALNAKKELNVDALVNRFPEVKATTIPAWINAWRRLNNLPSNANEKLLAAALKKAK